LSERGGVARNKENSTKPLVSKMKEQGVEEFRNSKPWGLTIKYLVIGEPEAENKNVRCPGGGEHKKKFGN